jgi:hypothetical protein
LVLLLRSLIHLSEVELQGALRDRAAQWRERVPTLGRALAFRQRPPAVKRPLYFKYGRVIDEGYAKELLHEVNSLDNISQRPWEGMGPDKRKAADPSLVGQHDALTRAFSKIHTIRSAFETWHRAICENRNFALNPDANRNVDTMLRTLASVHKALQEANVRLPAKAGGGALPIEELMADINEFRSAFKDSQRAA